MLIQPHISFEKSYRAYIEELGDEERYPYPMDLDYSDFAKLVSRLTDYSNGKNLPSHMVPNTTFWLIEDDEIIACSHLRHSLNDALKIAGGHIGLGVRPSFRGNGVGKRLLQATIEKAREMNIYPIHIHCYDDNPASQRLIESCGGLLDSTFEQESNEKVVLRFLVTF